MSKKKKKFVPLNGTVTLDSNKPASRSAVVKLLESCDGYILVLKHGGDLKIRADGLSYEETAASVAQLAERVMAGIYDEHAQASAAQAREGNEMNPYDHEDAFKDANLCAGRMTRLPEVLKQITDQNQGRVLLADCQRQYELLFNAFIEGVEFGRKNPRPAEHAPDGK